MTQPPGCSGVMGHIYTKILPFLEDHGWEFHFAGPSPRLASVLTEHVDCPPERLHYINNVSWSLRLSILKNRRNSRSFAYWFFAILQSIALAAEKLFRHDGRAYMLQGVERIVIDADKRWNFDLIAGKSPDFSMLDAVARVAEQLHKPLVAMIVDPHGKRNGLEFYPYDRDRQEQVLTQAIGAMFMSPLTRERYVQSQLVAASKAYAFTDCYPTSEGYYLSGRSCLPSRPSSSTLLDNNKPILRAVHIGMLPEWRPIETLFEAIRSAPPSVVIDFFGYVYPAARQLMKSDSQLSEVMRCWRQSLTLSECHFLAEDCDILLVVIGPRHLDNQPSKFFEFLGHRKPLLILGPLGNPIEEIINSLGIGAYCDILNPDSIINGFKKISNQYGQFVSAYEINNDKIEIYSAEQVAQHWADCLNKMLTTKR
jgi:glycosyltransferase involved in cell wall biosynthesis